MADRTGIALAFALLAAPAAADLPLRVIDGDTVEAGGVGYRFPGVDAAEMDSRCKAGRDAAEEARRALEDFLREGRIEIAPTGETCGWGRPCADLIVNGRSAIAEGLEAGWLRPWPSCGPKGCDEADRPKWCGKGE